jgi:hypothetical protein
MALVLPLLLVLMFSAFELGNYFRDWHTLSKGVRDGARFAARHDFGDFNCDTDPGTVADDVITATEEVVRTGVAGGTGNLLPNWDSADFDLSVACTSTVASDADEEGEELAGIYRGSASGAPVVTLTVRLPYRGLLGQFGWSGEGLNIASSEQAAVMGV